MEHKVDNHGASPMPKGKSKPGAPLFKKPNEKDEANAERDLTGQTDKSVKHMRKRLSEVPKYSSGSQSDKAAFEKK